MVKRVFGSAPGQATPDDRFLATVGACDMSIFSLCT
jgi:hypothetical protein